MKFNFNFAKIATEFETETCSRCGGSGQHSFCQMYGTVCFKCGGNKRSYTKRGKLAHYMFEQLLSKPASEIKPGMKIYENVGLSGSKKFQTVLSIGPSTCQYGIMENGVMVYKTSDGLDIETKGCKFGAVPKDRMYRVAATAGQKYGARRKALRFQTTLNKSRKSVQ